MSKIRMGVFALLLKSFCSAFGQSEWPGPRIEGFELSGGQRVAGTSWHAIQWKCWGTTMRPQFAEWMTGLHWEGWSDWHRSQVFIGSRHPLPMGATLESLAAWSRSTYPQLDLVSHGLQFSGRLAKVFSWGRLELESHLESGTMFGAAPYDAFAFVQQAPNRWGWTARWSAPSETQSLSLPSIGWRHGGGWLFQWSSCPSWQESSRLWRRVPGKCVVALQIAPFQLHLAWSGVMPHWSRHGDNTRAVSRSESGRATNHQIGMGTTGGQRSPSWSWWWEMEKEE